MSKISALILLVFILAVIAFSTWQLYAGNLTAAFSVLPFLLITYLFMVNQRK
jgi:hypothetical protein